MVWDKYYTNSGLAIVKSDTDSYQNILIKNLTIKGFYNTPHPSAGNSGAVYVTPGSNISFEHVNVSDNTEGLVLGSNDYGYYTFNNITDSILCNNSVGIRSLGFLEINNTTFLSNQDGF